MKKLLALLLAVSLFGTIFTGCSAEDKKTQANDYSKYICSSISDTLEDLNYSMSDNANVNNAYVFTMPKTENYLGYDFDVMIGYESTDNELVSSYTYAMNIEDVEEAVSTMESVCEQIDELYGDRQYFNSPATHINDVDDPVDAMESGGGYYAIWGLADYGFSEIEKECNEKLEQVLFDEDKNMTFVATATLEAYSGRDMYYITIEFAPRQVELSETNLF